MTDAQTLVVKLTRIHDGERFAVSDCGSAVGQYDIMTGRFVTVAAQTMLGTWAHAVDLRANGEPVFTYRLVNPLRAAIAGNTPNPF